MSDSDRCVVVGFANPQPLSTTVVRDSNVEVVRGFAIYGVVYIHGAYLWLSPGCHPIVPADVFRCSVPIFVILSAFFTRPTARWKGVVARVRRIILPFVVWSTFYFVLHHGVVSGPSLLKIVTRDFLGYGWAGQYFFLILLQAAVVVPILAGRSTNMTAILGLFAICAIGTFVLGKIHSPSMAQKIADDRLILFWIPHLSLGISLSRRWNRRLNPLLNAGAGALLLLISLALLWKTGSVLESVNARAWTPYQNPIVLGVTAPLFVSLSSLCQHLPERAARPIASVGRYSLGIFCINPAIIELCSHSHFRHAFASIRTTNSIVQPFVSVTLVVLMCYAVSLAIDRAGLSGLVR